MPDVDVLRDLVLRLAQEQKWGEIENVLIGQHPADLASLITAADSDYRERLFACVEGKSKPDVLAELEGQAESEVLQSLTSAELSDIVEEMPPDDAADVIGELSEDRSEEVLQLMENEESEDVRELLKYEEDTAGGIMTSDLVAFGDQLTVSEAIERIAYIDSDEPFYYAYIVDRDNHLKGYVGLWDILKVKDRDQSLGSLARTEFISVPTGLDQEEVAKLMSKYDISAMPVIDDRGSLVGRVTVDDVLDVIEEEASEDIFRMAGSDDAELENTSPLSACRVRLPWLLITMVITLFGSLILKRFMTNLSEVIALSFFVPIIMAMCGSTSMQSMTLIIRGLALGALEGQSIRGLLGRELVTGALMGIICSVLMFVWAKFVISHMPQDTLTYSPAFLAFTAGASLLSAMTFAASFGAFVPIVLDRLKIDPAVASGPFVTASNDILALLIYYTVTVTVISCHAPGVTN